MEVDGLNAGYAKALLEEYLENPEGVPAEWRQLFESGHSELVRTLPIPEPAPEPPPTDTAFLRAVAAATELVHAYRTHGHLAARLDPLGSEPVGDPALEPERLGPKLTAELQARIPARPLRVHIEGETLADVLPKLRETYSGTSAYEIEHISDHEQRVWLREAIESGRYRAPLSW